MTPFFAIHLFANFIKIMNNDYKTWNRVFWLIWSFIMFGAAVLVLSSCTTTKYVPVIEHHTDTLIQTNIQRDSIYVHDSISVTQKGDTISIDRWHTKYIEKQVHDTTYVSKTDTIPLPYPVEKEVPAELTWWHQTRLHIADIVLWMLLLLAVVYALRRFSRK